VRHLAFVLPLLVVIGVGDSLLSDDPSFGEQSQAERVWRRVRRTRSRSIIVLGSSTSVDWLPHDFVARLLGGSAADVTNLHLNGCHQGCTFALVKRMLRHASQRYRVALYGTNLFQLCESPHSKRPLQHALLLPTADIPQLFALYAHAEQPLEYIARFVGMRLVGAYGNSNLLQSRWRADLFGRPRRGRTHRWAIPRAPRRALHFCDYEPAQIAYKQALSEALLADLGLLADEVLLMLLPDQTLAQNDARTQAVWRAHRRFHQELADAYPHVKLVDLTQPGGARDPRHFRDGFHVSPLGRKLQRQLFERLVRDGGYARRAAHNGQP
jgi:hypothetical protein